MNRSKKPLITITGVLGKQGSSVAKTLLADGRFAVRGITRRTDTPEARELVRRGADLVHIPLTLGYKDAFENAFRGSYGVFLMTPNLPPPATHETALGKELADAAAAACGISYTAVWRTSIKLRAEGFPRRISPTRRVSKHISVRFPFRAALST